MHVNSSGRSLNRCMRSDRCGLRRICERHHGPLNLGLMARVVREAALRSLLLCACKGDCYKSPRKSRPTQTYSYFQFHCPSPRSKDTPRVLWIASPHVARGSKQMYYCLDGCNTANGFRSKSFCSNRQHPSLAAITRAGPAESKPLSQQKVSLQSGIRTADLEVAFLTFLQFPHLFFQIPQINSSI